MQRPVARLLGLATGACATRRSLRGGPGHRGPRTDHFDGKMFFNPDASASRTLGEFLRWQRTSRATPWPEWVENRAVPNVRRSPRRVRAPGLAFDALPRIDIVLVSHNHYDHLDLDTLGRLEHAHRPLFLTRLGNRAFLEEHGLRRVREFDWWQDARHEGAVYTYTPAQHWSGRGASGRNLTLWGGFVIEAAGCRVFFAGDTGYWRHFRDLRQCCGIMDVAMLPIGAYEPRWFMSDQHMNPEEAVRAHLDLEARLSIGTHYGCFQLTDEGIDDPLRELASARRAYGVPDERFRALETGETLLYRS